MGWSVLVARALPPSEGRHYRKWAKRLQCQFRMTDFIQIHVTTPSVEVAQAIAGRLLAHRLAACVQITGPIESRYWWQGKLETSQEWQCVIKSRLDLYPRLEAAVRGAHPYEVPEILATRVAAGNTDYLAWLQHELAPSDA